MECKNCGHKIKDKFCSYCGQIALTEEINFHYLVHELQHSLLHVDKGILYTARGLFKRPGHIIREYLEGKRVNHFKPFAYVFLLSTLFTLVVKASNQTNFLDDFLLGMANKDGDIPDMKDPFIEIILWLKNHYAISILFLIPIFSLATYASFRKSGCNYIQILLMNAFVYGQVTIIYFILHTLQLFFVDKDAIETFDTLKPFAAFFYTIWVYVQFFKGYSTFKSILLTILSHVIYTLMLILVLIGLMGVSKGLSS